MNDSKAAIIYLLVKPHSYDCYMWELHQKLKSLFSKTMNFDYTRQQDKDV